MPAKYYTKEKRNKAAAVLAKPTAQGQFPAGALSALPTTRGVNTSVATPRYTGRAQIDGRTVDIVDRVDYSITQSPTFAGKSSAQSTLQQAAAVAAQLAPPRDAARPLIPSSKGLFGLSLPSATPAAPTSTGASGFINTVKGFFGQALEIRANAEQFTRNLLGGADPFIVFGAPAALLSPKTAVISTAGAASVLSLPFLAGAGASLSGAGAGLSAAAPLLLRGGALLGAGALGYKGFKFLESKIPEPSNTDLLQDAQAFGAGVGDKLGNAFKGATNATGEAFSAAVDNVKNVARAALNNAKDAVTGAVQNVTEGIGESIGDAVQNVADTIGGGAGSLVESVQKSPILWAIGGAATVAIIGAMVKK